uniref:Aamy domain-containing protein n=1 Tax=Steinernema glaseri TaxID=37863 RepID=A0A1I7ZRS1_9BILA
MTMVQLLLPGTNLLYYGEEIGMENLPNRTQSFPQRGAMLWDDNTNAGFSDADDLKAGVQDNYDSINWKSQYHNPRSQWKMVQKLVKMRERSEALNQGQVYIGKLHEHSAFTLTRFLREDDIMKGRIFIGGVNFGKSTVDLPINDVPSINEADLKNARVETVNSGAQNYEPRTTIDLSSQTLQLGPNEGIIVSLAV